ncbi:hypothetical protein DL764_001858 [Monosporascus ibericus]|uniref:Uncharacterized protein n=1 Tax=Monosporascus ibericus TaxID=155417 RepID=A0A4Q4TR92_9PEZI|nr:hypothetical protein DL764_001858 [Monosporascus ibericus]
MKPPTASTVSEGKRANGAPSSPLPLPPPVAPPRRLGGRRSPPREKLAGLLDTSGETLRPGPNGRGETPTPSGDDGDDDADRAEVRP